MQESNNPITAKGWVVFSVTRKIAKSLQKFPKNDFSRKMKDFDTFTKIA